MTKRFPQTIKTQKSVLNPISGNKVYEVISDSTLEPNVGVLKFRIKNIIKKISKRGALTPSLYYDKEMHFAFFPRQDDEWLNEFYTRYGTIDSENTSTRLRFFNSPALAQTADKMLDFAEIKDGINVWCTIVYVFVRTTSGEVLHAIGFEEGLKAIDKMSKCKSNTLKDY